MENSVDRDSSNPTDDQLLQKYRQPGRNHVSVIRRRAGVACLLCRRRKVRCDAAQTGIPCTNCKLDAEACVIATGRRKRNTFYQTVDPSKRGTHTTCTQLQQKSAQKGSVVLESSPLYPGRKQLEESQNTTKEDREPSASLSGLKSPLDFFNINNTSCIQSADPPSDQADIIYSYYPFISADTMHQLVYEDVQYLEKLGCYRVPARPILDEFVKAYFCYIHPHQPILDEANFWHAYTNNSSTQTITISIFVLQAMLFGACSFVPISFIKQLGFSNFHTARATFYRRAKALFHIDSNRDTLSSAQGALLLTYYVSASDAKVNTHWLSNAIHLARSVNAHRHDSLKGVSVLQRSQLKRLWRCCLVRDRILALGLHRPLQISADEPESGQKVLYTESEEPFRDDEPLGLALTKSFSVLDELGVLLSQTLTILASERLPEAMTTSHDEVQACSERLDQWYTRAKTNFGTDGHAGKAVELRNQVVYIYYYSAKVALWNHAIYVSMIEGCPVHVELSKASREVEAAIHGIDTSLQHIANHDMLSFLPFPIIAHIAVPLVWHILNIKLDRQGEIADSRRRIRVYLTALAMLAERYEGVDGALKHLRQVVDCLDVHGNFSTSEALDDQHLSDSVSESSNGGDLITCLPHFFLRTVLTVQLFFAEGQYPEKHELPPSLASPSGSTAQSICTCKSNESWDLPDLGDTFHGLMDLRSPDLAPDSTQENYVYVNGDMTQDLDSIASTDDFGELFDLFSSA